MNVKRQTTRVSAYQTTDGQMFHDKVDARLHQAELAIRLMAGRLTASQDGYCEASAILDDREEWLAALIELARADAQAERHLDASIAEATAKADARIVAASNKLLDAAA